MEFSLQKLCQLNPLFNIWTSSRLVSLLLKRDLILYNLQCVFVCVFYYSLMCGSVSVCFIFLLLSDHVVLGAILIGWSCFPALSSVQGKRRQLHWGRRRTAWRAPSAVQRKIWRVVQRGLTEGKGPIRMTTTTNALNLTTRLSFYLTLFSLNGFVLECLLLCHSCCSGLSPASFSVATPTADARFSMTTVTQKSACPPSTGGTETTPASSW
jgi:hypothetical protein